MHRYEKCGLSGLQRVREMTLNDAHICLKSLIKLKNEFKRTNGITYLAVSMRF